MMSKKTILKSLSAASMLLTLAACSQDATTTAETSVEEATANLHQFDVNQHKLNKVVCDPMGEEGNPGVNDGLIAELFYLNSSQPRYRNVASYIEEGTASSQKLFFTDLNIPTRIFSTGFPTQTGGVVQDDSGNDLVEYFAVRFKSILKLADDNPEGQYELALLSDDGSVMKIIDDDGVPRVVVDNDGDHPTRMGCGDTVYFDADTAHDVLLEYYQGPRYHISLVPMWRRVTDTTVAENECGRLGNDRYFDYNNNSSPRQVYTDMLLRGWEPIKADNWHLPAMAGFNPCVQGTNPVISDFSLQASNEGFALLTWTTDIPATSQVLIKDSAGNEAMTESDNVLRTSHSVFVSSSYILFNETYTFQGIAISADLGKTLSRVLEASF